MKLPQSDVYLDISRTLLEFNVHPGPTTKIE